jgi:hypothetical protein
LLTDAGGVVLCLRTEQASLGFIFANIPTRERVNLDSTEFEIVVKGRLSPTLIAAIRGFDVSRCDGGLTHLVGWVSDQAQLHSAFDLFRDLNIEVVSVNPSTTDDQAIAYPSRSEDRP